MYCRTCNHKHGRHSRRDSRQATVGTLASPRRVAHHAPHLRLRVGQRAAGEPRRSSPLGLLTIVDVRAMDSGGTEPGVEPSARHRLFFFLRLLVGGGGGGWCRRFGAGTSSGGGGGGIGRGRGRSSTGHLAWIRRSRGRCVRWGRIATASRTLTLLEMMVRRRVLQRRGLELRWLLLPLLLWLLQALRVLCRRWVVVVRRTCLAITNERKVIPLVALGSELIHSALLPCLPLHADSLESCPRCPLPPEKKKKKKGGGPPLHNKHTLVFPSIGSSHFFYVSPPIFERRSFHRMPTRAFKGAEGPPARMITRRKGAWSLV